MKFFAAVLALLLLAAPAWADDPHTAQWQGTRTSGDAVMFFNSGSGVTLQDAANAILLYPLGIKMANNAKISFTETSGHTGSGLVVDGSNIMHFYGDGPGGSSLEVISFSLATNTPNITFSKDILLSSTATNFTTTLTPFFTSSQSVAGTVTSGAARYNIFTVGSDTLNTTGGGGPGGADVGYFADTLSTGFTGHRNALEGFLNVTGVSGNATTHFYTALAGESQSAVADDAGTGNALFGGFLATRLHNGGTGWNEQAGLEIDISSETGTSVNYKTGFKVIGESFSSVNASVLNVAMAVANQSGATSAWDYGLAFGSPQGVWAINSTGTLIGTPSTSLGGSSYAATHGIDFSAVTFSSDAFKSTGFLVDGSGNLTANALKIAPGTYTLPGGASFSTAPLVNNLVGTQATGSYNSGGNTAIFQNYIAQFNITRAGAAGVSNTGIFTNVGGTSQTGGINNLSSSVTINTATADVADSTYVSGNFVTTASANVGGSGGSHFGAIFGLATVSQVTSGATFWRALAGEELDLSIQSGATADFETGVGVVLLSNNAVAASLGSAGFSVSAQSGATATLDCGYCFTGYNGFNAIASTGSLIKLQPHGGSGSYPQATVTDGIDEHLFAFTGFAFRGANDTFKVDGSGNVTGLSYTGTGSTLTLAPTGVSTTNVIIGDNSAHNAIQFVIQPTGNNSIIKEAGVDTNRALLVEAAGTGSAQLGNTTDGIGFIVSDAGGAAANNVTIIPSVSGLGRVSISAAGTDTDINLNLAPKGAGVVAVGTIPGVSCTAGTVNVTTEVVTKGIVTHC